MGYFGNAAVNVPLSDTLAVRASGTYRKYGGFIDSIGTGGNPDHDKNINDSVSYGGRASLLFKPTDAISLRLTALAQDIKADAPSIIESDPVSLKRLYGHLSQSHSSAVRRRQISRVQRNGHVRPRLCRTYIVDELFNTEAKIPSDFTFALSPLVGAIFGVPNEFFLDQHHTDSRNSRRKFVFRERRACSTGLSAAITPMKKG